MNYQQFTRTSLAIAVLLVATSADRVAVAQAVPIAQTPLDQQTSPPPLNMLVMGKDHKNYYEAYNDAADLNGDGAIDVGYKPNDIEYFGYFNSYVCYNWNNSGSRFEPAVPAGGANGKECGGANWSGDFLNYLTTGRFDALRKVLYGGKRAVDTADETVLQGAFFPQDGHSWGKEYRSIERDGYDIRRYAPLTLPDTDRYHLFAVTTVTDGTAPLFRVLKNSPFRIWNWVSIEGPVANNRCFNASNNRVDCVGAGGATQPFPGNPTSRAQFDQREIDYAIPDYRFGSNTLTRIDCSNGACNPFGDDNQYMTIIEGEIRIRNDGNFRFRVNGDDAIDFTLYDSSGNVVASAGCYGNRGFGACGGNEQSAEVFLAEQNYRFKFRHSEGAGGDGYRLEWRKNSGGSTMDWRVIDTNSSGNQNGNGDFVDFPTITTYDLTPTSGSASSRDDYQVRVLVCPEDEALRESNCKVYANGTSVKPTGLLHDYGETERMYFGLLTGSQPNNLEGGVLRRNLSSFAQEINSETGQFQNVNGIVRTLDRFRMIGGGYNGGTTNNSTSDTNWNWANGTGNCPSIGGRAIVNGECRMWGNPIGEMMFETLRYLGGAEAPHSVFATGGATQGRNEETTLGLTTESWRDPYKPVADGGLGYLSCAKPVMTVISDINPSYDGDQIPGSPWGSPSFDNPETLDDFDLQDVGDTLWNLEFGGGSRDVFIGQVETNPSDGAPTPKSASSFGNIRGLSPEEPTKGGSYAASAVASYAWTKTGRINPLSPERVRTYSVALASPLPRIEFPIGNNTVTFVPFAKTAGGTFGGGAQKPTNTIVDFYIEEFVNLPGQDVDTEINEGRPYAVFRINYEDVEQGNDHDMDAIVRYEVKANADGTVTMSLSSEYAAGSAIQHMGYVATGTTADGVYLEVRDRDTAAASSPAYIFNVPPGRSAGYCNVAPMPADCASLPLTSERVFTPSDDTGNVTTLRDPLWYAAKYGGFNDRDGDRQPNLQREWDEDEDGTPDNYFLVTNALSLREQLDEAFAKIERDSKVSSAVAASGARKVDGFLAYVPEYNSRDWTGDLKAYTIDNDGQIVEPPVWSAVGKLPPTRNISVSVPNPSLPGRFQLTQFNAAAIGTDVAEQELALGFAAGGIVDQFGAGITPDSIVAFLRGDQSLEVPSTFADDGIAPAGKVFRYRSRVIGDIVNSQPEVLTRGSFGYTQLPRSLGGGRDGAGSYGEFLRTKKFVRKPVVFVGSNGGMLHAFDASDTGSAGTELFAVVPNYAIGKLGALADPAYDRGVDFPFIVDGLMGQGDARINDEWRSILLLSPGRGGGGAMGFDVTDPANDGARLLFEFQDAELGNYLWRGQVILAEDNRWYALFGNGVNNASGQPRIFLIDLATGDARSIAAGTANPGGPNGMVSVAAVDGGDLVELGEDDADFDGKVDTVFGADYEGNVWRFDLSSENPDDWDVAFEGAPMFTAQSPDGDPQLITGAMTVFLHPEEDFIVYFGTGRFLLQDDLDTPADPEVQSFYAVWARNPSNRTDLVEQRITSQSLVNNEIFRSTSVLPRGADSFGWFLDLAVDTASGDDARGERFIGEPRVELGRAIFTTFEVIGDQCAPGGGINRLYSLNAVSGAAELTFSTCAPGSECSANQSGTAGGVELRDADGAYTAPALSPPLVVNPAGAVIPGQDSCVPGVDPDCDLPADSEDSLIGRQCLAGLSVLLPEGLRKFSDVQCGRASWRQIR